MLTLDYVSVLPASCLPTYPGFSSTRSHHYSPCLGTAPAPQIPCLLLRTRPEVRPNVGMAVWGREVGYKLHWHHPGPLKLQGMETAPQPYLGRNWQGDGGKDNR